MFVKNISHFIKIRRTFVFYQIQRKTLFYHVVKPDSASEFSTIYSVIDIVCSRTRYFLCYFNFVFSEHRLYSGFNLLTMTTHSHFFTSKPCLLINFNHSLRIGPKSKCAPNLIKKGCSRVPFLNFSNSSQAEHFGLMR